MPRATVSPEADEVCDGVFLGRLPARGEATQFASVIDLCAELPLKRIRGQISCLPANTQSGQLRTVLCAKGYVAPPRDGTHTLGASFNFQQTDDTPSVAEHQANLEMLEQISADLYQRLQADPQRTEELDGRVAFRCAPPCP